MALIALATMFGKVCAGIYHFGESEEWNVPDAFIDPTGSSYYSLLAQLRALPAPQVDVEKPLRKRYLLAEHAAATKAKLTTEQKIDLSAVLLRRGNPGGAIQVLLPATRDPLERNNFLIYSHLAAAYAAQGNLASALEAQKSALELWPKDVEALQESNPAAYKIWEDNQQKDRLPFFREAEEYQAKLYRSRLLEKGAAYDSVDPLFGEKGKTVRYVGPSGEFEVGTIAPEEKAKLPPDALEIMRQLVLWNPQDRRLYWQLGELYNARGGAKNIQAARKIFDELIYDQRERAPEVQKRRAALFEYRIPTEKTRRELGFDAKALGIGLGIGTVIGVFLLWQVQEIRRRRSVRKERGR